MQPGLIWLVGGAVLLVIEVLAPGAFMMWLGLAALGTGAVALAVDLGIAGQVVVFALFAAVSIALGLRLRRPRHAGVLNTAQSGLIGRPARVLTVEGSQVRVRIGDSDWTARLARDVPTTSPGAELRVVGVDGTTVVIGDGVPAADG